MLDRINIVCSNANICFDTIKYFPLVQRNRWSQRNKMVLIQRTKQYVNIRSRVKIADAGVANIKTQMHRCFLCTFI